MFGLHSCCLLLMPVTGCHLDNLSLTEDRLPPYVVNTKAFKTPYPPGLLKAQLISKCPFTVLKSPKKPTKFFQGFLP